VGNEQLKYNGRAETRLADTAEQTGGLGLATLRVDGFASLSAGYDGGRVTTKPSRWRGSWLRVNAKADFGRLLAECSQAARVRATG
jgi:hypothetical protein